MKRYIVFVVILVSVCTGALFGADGFQVIVNKANPVTSLSIEQVSDMFLKKNEQWPDGMKVVPIDQGEDSSARISFTEKVMGKKVRNIKAYWRKVIFSGLGTPPMEMPGDMEVMEFVEHEVGAIGYVERGVKLEPGVKILTVLEAGVEIR